MAPNLRSEVAAELAILLQNGTLNLIKDSQRFHLFSALAHFLVKYACDCDTAQLVEFVAPVNNAIRNAFSAASATRQSTAFLEVTLTCLIKLLQRLPTNTTIDVREWT